MWRTKMASNLTLEQIAELRRLEKAATEERTTSGMRVGHLDYVLALVDAAPALLDAAEENVRLHGALERIASMRCTKIVFDEQGCADRIGQSEKFYCGPCVARAALEENHDGK
jgi:hypothetical protein